MKDRDDIKPDTDGAECWFRPDCTFDPDQGLVSFMNSSISSFHNWKVVLMALNRSMLNRPINRVIFMDVEY